MADEQLRLEAIVIDKFGKPLADLRKQLASVKGPNLTSSQREFARFHEEVKRSTGALRDGLSGAIDGIGLRSAAAVLSIAGVTAAVKKFAEATGELRALSRETGISIRNFQLLQAVASQFGANPEAMSAGLKQFASNLYDIKRGVSDLIPLLIKADPSGGLLKQLKEGDPNKALDVVLEFLGKVNKVNPETAGRISEQLFGTRDFARLTLDIERLKKALSTAAAQKGPISEDDIKKAQEFSDKLAELERSANKLGTTVGRELLGPMTSLIEKMNEIIEGGAKVKKFFEELWSGKSVGDAASNALGGLEKHGAPMTEERKKELLEKRRRGELPDMNQKPNPWWWEAGKDLGIIKGDRYAPAKPDVDAEAKKKAEADFNAMRRLSTVGDDRKARDAVKEGSKQGTEDGIKAAFDKISMEGRPLGDGAGRVWNASYGGGGGFRAGGGGYSGADWSTDSEADPRRAPPTARRGGRSAEPDGSGPATDPGRMGMDNPVRRAVRGRGVNGEAGGSTAVAMQAAMDQLRKEGVPEANLRAAAAHLVGQAIMESGLRPGTVHDQGTGYGIYGARDPIGPGRRRRSAMLAWLAANGYARDSLEGQTRYMAHEAMSGLYPKTRRTLMGATPEGLERDSWTVTREFEAPLITNDRRAAVLRAYRSTAKAARGEDEASPAFPKGWRERAGSAFGAVKGAGAFGVTGPELRGRAALDVHVKSDGRANVKVDGGSLFEDVKVNRGRSMSPAIDV